MDSPYFVEEPDSFDLGQGFIISLLTARHFSGRAFKNNQSLWVSFALVTPTFKFYFGGDSGYGKHFKEIGEKFGPFDLAILENGQYNDNWRNIHMMPDESYQAGIDLKAKKIMPVHSAKFVLAKHAWKEPLEKISKLDIQNHLLVTPLIGQKTNLSKLDIYNDKWWIKVE